MSFGVFGGKPGVFGDLPIAPSLVNSEALGVAGSPGESKWALSPGVEGFIIS